LKVPRHLYPGNLGVQPGHRCHDADLIARCLPSTRANEYDQRSCY
jgi:hypothetical protein